MEHRQTSEVTAIKLSWWAGGVSKCCLRQAGTIGYIFLFHHRLRLFSQLMMLQAISSDLTWRSQDKARTYSSGQRYNRLPSIFHHTAATNSAGPSLPQDTDSSPLRSDIDRCRNRRSCRTHRHWSLKHHDLTSSTRSTPSHVNNEENSG